MVTDMTDQARDRLAPRSGWVGAVRRFARITSSHCRCELCRGPTNERHRHFVDPVNHQLLCTCEECRRLESRRNPARLLQVPQRVSKISVDSLSDAHWEALSIPVGIAFFYKRSADGQVATCYPGPAGATQSSIAPELWRSLESYCPQLTTLQPDVEALLVNRTEHARYSFCVPIDRCYELIGVMRAHWRGFTGGPELRAAVARFFAELESLAQTELTA